MDEVLEHLRAALRDRYRLDRQIGAGGAATVHLATDLRHRRPVAIKVLRPEYTASVGRSRFLREIEIVAGLTHPNILPLHDSGSTGGIIYFVMPFVEGETLRDLLDRSGTLPVEDAVRIAAEVADALAYAHGRGVIHRDIKPQNIMIEGGHAVVADFGIAMSVAEDGQERLTRTGLTVGTPQYMSPEQAGGGRDVDARTDIYSLGCVLFEMLAGDPPFAGSNGRVVLARKLIEVPPDVQVLRGTVGDGLAQVVDRSLAVDPSDRFQTCADLRSALDAVSRGEPAPAGAQHAGAAVRRRPVRTQAQQRHAVVRRITRGAGAGVAGLLLLVAVGYLNTRAFDIKLQIPDRFTPSEPDYLNTGRQALTGFVIQATFFLLVAILFRFIVDFAARAFRLIPAVGPAVTDTLRSVSRGAGNRWQALDDSTRGGAFFIASIGLAALVVVQFATLMYSVFFGDVALLSCANRDTHRAFSVVLSIVTAGLAFGWYRTFKRTFGHEIGARTRMARWGSAIAIIALVVIQSVPWQLMWKGSNPRVLIDGERGYVLVETPGELVVHNAERRTTEVRANGPDNGVERVGVAGYVFEEPEAFHSGRLDCAAITTPLPPTGASP